MEPADYSIPIVTRFDTTLGYLYFIDRSHPMADSYGKVYHHRHIAAINLGRWLLSSEHVHHRNEDKTDNSPENLEVLSQSQHAIKHCLERGLNVKTEKTCPACGVVFITLENTYCSRACAAANREGKLSGVTKEELQRLVWEMPTIRVAELFRVSDVAIGKRCKKLGISKPPRGYWEKIYHL